MEQFNKMVNDFKQDLEYLDQIIIDETVKGRDALSAFSITKAPGVDSAEALLISYSKKLHLLQKSRKKLKKVIKNLKKIKL